MSRIAVLIVAAGKGVRSGRARPKQYELLSGKPMLLRSAEAFGDLPVHIVIGPGQEDHYTAAIPGGTAPITGGARRQDSVRLGLEALEPMAPDFVLIHDAARPLARSDMFVTALSVAREFGGAIPALTITDVVQRGPVGIESTGSERLVRVQTPQAFRAQPLLRAYRAAAADGFEGTDTSSCIEKYTDEQVRTFPGDEGNLKVTYAHDVAVAGRLLNARR